MKCEAYLYCTNSSKLNVENMVADMLLQETRVSVTVKLAKRFVACGGGGQGNVRSQHRSERASEETRWAGLAPVGARRGSGSPGCLRQGLESSFHAAQVKVSLKCGAQPSGSTCSVCG